MKPFLAAIRFLTILPLPASWGHTADDLAKSVPFFPVIGLLLGTIAAALTWWLSCLAPQPVTSAMMIIVLLLFSGGLHMDGLADTADGCLSARSKTKILKIMQDSHVGAMGVMGIVCVLLLKFAALSSLPSAYLWPAILLMPLAGRSAMVIHLALLPYVRSQGLAAVFYKNKSGWSAVWAGAVLVIGSWCLLGVNGLYLAGLCLTITLGLAVYFWRKLGGATGDTLGAACELLELIPALFLAIYPLTRAR